VDLDELMKTEIHITPKHAARLIQAIQNLREAKNILALVLDMAFDEDLDGEIVEVKPDGTVILEVALDEKSKKS